MIFFSFIMKACVVVLIRGDLPTGALLLCTQKICTCGEIRKCLAPAGRQHSFIEIDYEIFSTVIHPLPLIQQGQLSFSVKEFSASILLAFCINLWRAVIGPSATLTGRKRPAIDLLIMLTVNVHNTG